MSSNPNVTGPVTAPPVGSPLPPPPLPPKRRSRFGLGVVTGVALTAGVVGGGLTFIDTQVTTTPVSRSVGNESTDGVELASFTSVGDLVESVRPSVVSIHQTITQRDAFGNVREGTGAGTGFVLSADGYIVTNSHVIAEGEDTTVDFDDGTSLPAEIVAHSPAYDLAVLKVDRDDLVPLAIGDSDALRIGDELVAIGYALDLSGEPSVTTGVLSARDRTLTEPGGERLVNLLQTDTAINPGNSGGPLLNQYGEVVGINTAVAGQAQNIGFSIAISQAAPLIEELRSGTVPQLALLGVSSQPSTSDTEGAEVVDVVDGSAADVAGIRIGDTVTSFDGVAVDGPEALGVQIAEHRPDDHVTVVVVRDGRPVELDAVLGVRTS